MVVALGILGLGYLGPHPAGQGSAASPSAAEPSQLASAVARRQVTPTPAASRAPSPGKGPGQFAATTGLSQVAEVPGERISWLPLQITSRRPALIGQRLFYVVGGDRLESSVLGSSADPQVLVSTPRCQAINQLVAAGNYLLYVVTEASGPLASIGGCDTFGGVLSWTIRLIDLRTGASRTLAQGNRLRTSLDIDEFPIHVAMTSTAYAFDRPNAASDSGGGETVEVHSFDGRTLWTATTQDHVSDVMLGDDELAVVTQTPWPALDRNTLWLANAARPDLVAIADIGTSAFLTADGRFLTWDTPPHGGLSPNRPAPTSPSRRRIRAL